MLDHDRVTRSRIAAGAYVFLVAGLAIGQVVGAQSTSIVLLLLLITVPCGLLAHVTQYPVILSLGAAIDAPPRGSIPLAITFVAIWAVAAIVNLRLAASLMKWVQTRRRRP